MNGYKIAKEYFPNASNDEIGFTLWNKTGWPCFFEKGEESLREQLAKQKRAYELRRDTCNLCGKIKWPSQLDKLGICGHCKKLLTMGGQNELR